MGEDIAGKNQDGREKAEICKVILSVQLFKNTWKKKTHFEGFFPFMAPSSPMDLLNTL